MNYLLKKPFLLISFLLLLVYSSFLTGVPTVNPDAQIILPNLEKYNSFIDYINALTGFRTIDFQPFRDLTFYIDLFFFDKLKLNTFVIQNILWWVGCSFMTFKVAKKLFPDKNEALILLCVLNFSVDPLFSYVISWGIARKHILAFFFILCATHELLKTKDLNVKNIFKIAFLYLLSVLSQPIGIFWPIWVFYYLTFQNNVIKKRKYLFFTALSLIHILFLFINYRYYTSSGAFLYNYDAKDLNFFNLGDKVLALGHYFFQMFFPFFLSFKYRLGDFFVLIGLCILVLVCISLYFDKKHKLINGSILLLGWSSFFLILATPYHLFDTYLLLPFLSIFLFIVHFLTRLKSQKLPFVLIGLCFFFSVRSFYECKNWLNAVSFAESSFNRRKNCINARNYVRISYESNVIPTEYSKQYLKENQCLENVLITESQESTHINFLANIIFYEKFSKQEERILLLNSLPKKTILIDFIKAAIFIRDGKELEADKTLSDIIKKSSVRRATQLQYNYLVTLYVHPYCQKKKWKECTDITSKYSQYIPQPYL